MSDLAKIEEIYYAALEQPPEGRDEFLAEICRDDENLRREIESLLSFEEEARNFIETPPEDVAAAIFNGQAGENPVGQILNHYRVVSILGAGGMGEVYLAEDTKLDRRVALKILPAEFAENEARMSRFIREAKTASALNHPNIITIYEIGTSGKTNFISTEFIEGETLKTRINSNPLKLQTALDIAVQIASALSAAHEAGIVHRDIKPENIMIRPDGLVKVLDFGIAKLTGRGDTATQRHGDKTETVNAAFPRLRFTAASPTKTGGIIGTASYMSPEQARGKKIDARTDIFSFGIVFYEMLTGKRAFSGATPLEIVSSILKDEPVLIRRILPDIPPEIEQIVEKMLRKNADERYQTAGDLLTDLKNISREMDSREELEGGFDESTRLNLNGQTTADGLILKTLNPLSFVTGKLTTRKYGAAAVFSSLLLLILFGVGLRYFILPASDTPIDSIAVLPFQNTGGDADNEFLGDGLAETLINDFTRIPELRVTARSTAFSFRGREDEPQAVGKELGVKTILTGKITHRDDRFSIQVDLINVADGTQIFGKRYDGTQTEILALQQKIVRDVAGRLRLSDTQQQQAAKKNTELSEAYKLYLRGRFYWNKRSAENLKNAIREFKQAADLDPNYALAFVGLADSYLLLEEYAGTPASETLPQARAFAARALEIDESLGEAHVSLGVINSQMWNYGEAEYHFKRAIELNPKYSTAYLWYCTYLRDTERFEESLSVIKQAQELDPLSSIISVNVGIMYLVNNDAGSAVKEFEKLIQLDPNYWNAHSWLGLAYLKQGRETEAFAALQKGVELSRRANRAIAFLGYAKAMTGNRAEAASIVKELEEKFSKREATILNVAMTYAGLGDKNQAISWLEKNLESRSGESARIRWYPGFESLRTDPRYQTIISRLEQKSSMIE